MVIDSLLTVATGLLTVPVAVLCFEVIAAIAFSRRREGIPLHNIKRPRLAVLVPAHNESAGLLPTLNDLKAQLRIGERLIVVADNCQDDTADLAAAAGAEVLERHDLTRHGKGYALDWGIQHLRIDPPDVLVMVDADCRIAQNALEHLVKTCVATQRPTQALYIMNAPEGGGINYQVAEFAWHLKNFVRPSGLRAAQLPCQLMGTGMAFPWDVIHSADLASDEIVEDLKLGLELAAAGAPPLFCPSALVQSRFPVSTSGTINQRQRWEKGHIRMILSNGLRFIYLGLRQCNLMLLALALDLIVPPLALLLLFVAGTTFLACIAVLFGCSPVPLLISSIALFALVGTLLAAWWAYGRDLLPARALLLVVPYICRKAAMYPQALFHRSSLRWIRTDRELGEG